MRKTLTSIVMTGLLGLSCLYAQQVSLTDYLAECERKYGSDADLVNGEKYYYPYRQSQGDPFFFTEPRNAMVRVQDKEFTDQLLRYDLFNQQLILDFKDLYGATSSLVMRNEWVEAFAFENLEFIRMTGPEGMPVFFQLISSGHVTCVYRWGKNRLLSLSSGVQSYYFTEPVKESYLVIQGQYYPYRSNRAFLRAFEPEIQKTVKQFLKQAKINVVKAPDSQIRHLIEYCNSLYHEES